jgi:putative OPT family oligopeptide transporter
VSPVVPAEADIPELTVKAVILSILLSMVLGAANAYLGLFAGMTVSASIPAAIVSMTILRWCRHSTILENNIVQTAASSGEALAAGVIFTIPAMVLIGAWMSFDYWQTTCLAFVGGLLGVVCTIPLRRALIVDQGLRFPEGVATAEVLKLGATHRNGPEDGSDENVASSTAQFRTIITASLVGAGVKFAEGGLRLWEEAIELVVPVGSGVGYIGLILSPALLGVGFIVGVNASLVVCAGGIVTWMVLLPLYTVMVDTSEIAGPPLVVAKAIWSSQLRFVGIGAMLVGGVWTLFHIRGPIRQSVERLIHLSRSSAPGSGESVVPLRTEQDVPMSWMLGALTVSVVGMAILYTQYVGGIAVGLVMTALMVVAAFVFASVAGYMAGLVGSSSNPVSGVTISTLMLAAGCLILLLGKAHPQGPAAALLIAAVVCCAAAMGGDNLQDLKTGQLVGATPWKQQVMQVVGVASAAVVIVPILSLLQTKYGIGPVTADHPHPLTAPQAVLMGSLAQGMFGQGLPWAWVMLGGLLGCLVIAWDQYALRTAAGYRVPVLAVALGMYLPLKLSATILVGGLVAARVAQGTTGLPEDGKQSGVLAAAGLVTGEALMGILLALPVALASIWPQISADPFQLVSSPPWGPWPGLTLFLAVTVFLHRQARCRKTG